jgi:hypothetical protein
MAHGVAADMPGVIVGAVAEGVAGPELRLARFLREARARRGPQKQDVDLMRARRIDRTRPPVDLRALPLEPARELLDLVGDRVVDLGGRIARHHRDAVLGEAGLARRRQLESPGAAVADIRAGEDLQRKLEVESGAGERADRADVARRIHPGQRVPGARGDVEARLVPIDAAVMGRVADRGADVAADLEPGEPGGERRRAAAGGAARPALEIPGLWVTP